MKESELRKNMAVLPMSTVIKLTGLSARQIRYYEAQDLVIPERTGGNHRLYSLYDIDKLLEIKDILQSANSMVDVKRILKRRQTIAQKQPTQEEISRALRHELEIQSNFYRNDSTTFNQPRF
ncbi:MerR family transcriptional regulator [Lactovum miscens]|uniref:MerR family glutamine synthetase transcriptional repressor n=1 Tax=Lactovum miscens TaxID=190387 RepID=A0A841C8Q3_9LACT|nr:MerR family transcriptional regulator [Lactovum miscens]MBB5887962.1 MerR family glutamine synthetase transcriptional repressor [Lactovum miscens]